MNEIFSTAATYVLTAIAPLSLCSTRWFIVVEIYSSRVVRSKCNCLLFSIRISVFAVTTLSFLSVLLTPKLCTYQSILMDNVYI